MYLRFVDLCLIGKMPPAVLNGAFLKDAKGKDFLLVVDIRAQHSERSGRSDVPSQGRQHVRVSRRSCVV